MSHSRIQMNHVTYMNESCHIYEWDMSHRWMSHFAHMNESFLIPSHRWMSHVTDETHHVTQIVEPCHTHGYRRVMSRIWMSHVTHMKESCHRHEWDISHRVLTDVTHSYVWHDSFICETWFTHMNEIYHTEYWVMSHVTHSYTWHIHTRDTFIHVTHSYTWLIHTHDSFMYRWCTKGLVLTELVAHSYVWHDMCDMICVTWYVWHDMCDMA